MAASRKSVIALLLASFLLSAIILPPSARASSNEEWETALAVGKFLYSEPPKPDQIFKIQYRIMNGTVESFDALYGVTAKVNSNGSNGVLDIKYPRNYPYTNEFLGGYYVQPILFVNGTEAYHPAIEITECFFVFSIPFRGSSEIESAWTYLAVAEPYHGDDIPDSCIPETIVENIPVKKDGTISVLHQFRAGVAAENVVCKEGLKLVLDPNGKPYCATPSSAKQLVERWD